MNQIAEHLQWLFIYTIFAGALIGWALMCKRRALTITAYIIAIFLVQAAFWQYNAIVNIHKATLRALEEAHKSTHQ